MSPSETEVGAQCILPSSSKSASGSLCQKVGVKLSFDPACCAKTIVFCAGTRQKTKAAVNSMALTAFINLRSLLQVSLRTGIILGGRKAVQDKNRHKCPGVEIQSAKANYLFCPFEKVLAYQLKGIATAIFLTSLRK